MMIALLRSLEYAPMIASIIFPGWNQETPKTLTINLRNSTKLSITLIEFHQGEFQTQLIECYCKTISKDPNKICKCKNSDYKPIKFNITLKRISDFLKDPLSKTPLFDPPDHLKRQFSSNFAHSSVAFSYPPPFSMDSEQTNDFDKHESTIFIYPLRPYVLEEITTRMVDQQSIKPAKLVFSCFDCDQLK